jgi:DNA sulfur modification protein DndD
MKLKKLVLTDFGVYQGKVVFDLSLGNKPIIIFGGKNGSGKTTILESIKLCLYGMRGINRKIGRKEYEAHIRNRIHRHKSAVVPLNHTSVSLSFDYSIFGNENIYEVIRSWKIKPDSFQEQLLLLLNGKPLTNVPEEHWQEYIDDLIPPSIAELFFFDGEKIQELIIDNFNEQALANDVKRILGLNIIEKLQADLDTYLYRQRKENTVIEHQTKLEGIENSFRAIDQKYQGKILEVSHLQAKVEHNQGQIEKLERKISLESSGYAFQREDLKTQLTHTDIELENAEKQLHELSAGLLPFALVPELCQELESQLISEGELQQWQASNSLLKPKIINIRQTISSNKFWSRLNGNLTIQVRQEMTNQISKMLEELLGPGENQNGKKILHQVSDFERYQLIAWINESIRLTPQKIKNIGDRLVNLERTRQEITIKLRNIPDDDVLRPLMENLNRLNQEFGKLNEKLNRVTQEKEILYNEREEAERQIKKAFDNLKSGKRVEDRLLMVKKTQITLNDFLSEITQRKIVDLEILVVRKFTELSRKPDLLKSVSINPQSFHIQLFDYRDCSIPKELLSAGEKQMFAIALLWALRELSGKPFPVIIDTPLGRLDSDHRDHLVNKYFPRVSHQVILFSTDTEIDKEYFSALEPDISRSYHLDYDPAEGKTNVSYGYFWDGGRNAIE